MLLIRHPWLVQELLIKENLGLLCCDIHWHFHQHEEK